MAIIWGLNPSASYGGAVGDIFFRTTTGDQFRWNGSTWDTVTSRGDVAPALGVLNDRLSKAGARPYELGWRNASDGVVMAYEQTVPSDDWFVIHSLSSWLVEVIVFSPGNADPGAPQTQLIPDVVFESALSLRLKFHKAVTGTALVRR